MPIDLTNTNHAVDTNELMQSLFGTSLDKPRVTPGLFDEKLTGSGYGKSGYLNTYFSNIGTNEKIKPTLHGDPTGFAFGNQRFVPKMGDFLHYPGTIVKSTGITDYRERLTTYRKDLSGKGTLTHEMQIIVPSLYTSHFDNLYTSKKSVQNFIETPSDSTLFNLTELKEQAEHAIELEDSFLMNGKLTNKEQMSLLDNWNTVFLPEITKTHLVFLKTEVTYISKNRTVHIADSIDPKNPSAPMKEKKTEKFDYFFAPTTMIAFYPIEVAIHKTEVAKAGIFHFNQFNYNMERFKQLIRTNTDQVIICRIPTKAFHKVSDGGSAHQIIENLLGKFMLNTVVNNQQDVDEVINQLKTHFSNENLRNALRYQAENVRDHSTDMLIQLFDDLITNKDTYSISHMNAYELANYALITFNRMESLEESWVTVDDYNRIYTKLQELQNVFNWNDLQLRNLAATQLRLMLAENLHLLDVARKTDALYAFKANDKQVYNDFMNNPHYSMQQKAVITTTHPLATVSAGAGSGKSYTLIGRLEYLKAQGEDLSRAMVLSFTNAAAQNITNRYPNVKSLTLGDLFNQIYSLTFPNQILSHPTTFKNALSCVNPNAYVFNNYKVERMETAKTLFIKAMEQLTPSGFTKPDVANALANLSNFILEYYDEAMALMNAIHQTTLELQAIVIYNMILNDPKSLQIPSEYRDIDFIITDESQDISTFEYILLLSLVTVQKTNFMIIGDGSQTLYEFRNSNPRFLTAIESSGVFESFRLTTNYRSKQAILNYANQFLQVIDANKVAKIQLQSNNLKPITEYDLDKAITVKYICHTDKKIERKQNESLGRFIEENKAFENWFIERVQKGEQIAFMSHTRKELDTLEESLIEVLRRNGLSDKTLERIVTTREKPKTQLSDIINKSYEALIDFDVTQHYELQVKEFFFEAIINRFKNKDQAFVPSYVIRILDRVLNLPGIYNSKLEVLSGNSSKSNLNAFVIQALIDEEIRLNAMSNFLNKEKNATKDYTQYPLILTTIHSAKGLEFDHTVVIYNSLRKGSKKQEALRLYGVALTRAKESEFIIELNDEKGLATPATSDLIGMYVTPIKTARLRVYRELKGLSANTTINGDNEDD